MSESRAMNEAVLSCQGLGMTYAEGKLRTPVFDNLELAIAKGVTALVQPGGSVKDAEVIAAADAAGVAMLFTGVRHFRH